MSKPKRIHANVQDLISRTIRNSETNCLEWQGNKTKAGYGRLPLDSKIVATHRFMATLVYGEPTENKNNVLHSCHNPSCINPDHLRWGSPKENMQDMFIKNRTGKTLVAIGKFNGKRLKPAQVIAIREAYSQGIVQDVIAKEYGIGRAHVSRIVTKDLWSNI